MAHEGWIEVNLPWGLPHADQTAEEIALRAEQHRLSGVVLARAAQAYPDVPALEMTMETLTALEKALPALRAAGEARFDDAWLEAVVAEYNVRARMEGASPDVLVLARHRHAVQKRQQWLHGEFAYLEQPETKEIAAINERVEALRKARHFQAVPGIQVEVRRPDGEVRCYLIGDLNADGMEGGCGCCAESHEKDIVLRWRPLSSVFPT